MAQWTIKHPDGTQSVVGGIVGALVLFAGSEPPAHTLLCNGRAVSRETYKELFEAIGTSHGAGDGSTTFNLPNFANGQFIRGTGGNAAKLGTTQAEGLPNIEGHFGSTFNGYKWLGFEHHDGAFDVWETHPNCFKPSSSDNDYSGTNIQFSAAKYNAIYGASSHVTPYNGASTICIVYE